MTRYDDKTYAVRKIMKALDRVGGVPYALELYKKMMAVNIDPYNNEEFREFMKEYV